MKYPYLHFLNILGEHHSIKNACRAERTAFLEHLGQHKMHGCGRKNTAEILVDPDMRFSGCVERLQVWMSMD